VVMPPIGLFNTCRQPAPPDCDEELELLKDKLELLEDEPELELKELLDIDSLEKLLEPVELEEQEELEDSEELEELEELDESGSGNLLSSRYTAESFPVCIGSPLPSILTFSCVETKTESSASKAT